MPTSITDPYLFTIIMVLVCFIGYISGAAFTKSEAKGIKPVKVVDIMVFNDEYYYVLPEDYINDHIPNSISINLQPTFYFIRGVVYTDGSVYIQDENKFVTIINYKELPI